MDGIYARIGIHVLQFEPWFESREVFFEDAAVFWREPTGVHNHVRHSEPSQMSNARFVGKRSHLIVQLFMYSGPHTAVPVHGLLPVRNRVQHVVGYGIAPTA